MRHNFVEGYLAFPDHRDQPACAAFQDSIHERAASLGIFRTPILIALIFDRGSRLGEHRMDHPVAGLDAELGADAAP
jgi:hypothetical protein